MRLPRSVVDEVRRLDESQLRQLLILARGLLVDSEQPVVEISDVPGMPTVRYRQRHVRCGKATCGSCPHGPYWYAHWTEDGRRRTRYIGAELPAEVRRKLEALEEERHETAARHEAQDDPGERSLAAGAGPAPRGRGRLRLVRD